MEQESLLHAFSTLAASIDPLIRAEEKSAIITVVSKMMEIILKIKP
jgi:hypothetical protein